MAFLGIGKPNIKKMEVRRDVAGLIKALEDPKDRVMRRAAADALARIGDSVVVEALQHVLDHHQDSEVRRTAVEVLERIGGSAAGEVLLHVFQHDRSEWVRKKAAEALGNLKEPRAVEVLMDSVASSKESEGVRRAAIEALRAIGHARAIPVLVEALHVWELCLPAARALADLGWQPGQDETAFRYWVAQKAWDTCAVLGDVAIQGSIEILTESARLGAYAQSLLSAQPFSFGYACWGEGQMIGMQCKEMREAAGQVLVRVGASAVPKLIEAMQTGGSWNRMTFAWALGEIGDARAVEPLINLLQHREAVEKDCTCDCMPLAVIEALVKIGKPSIAPLVACLEQETDWTIRNQIDEALQQLGWRGERL